MKRSSSRDKPPESYVPSEERNPYDDPGLREAYRRGWRACLKGKPRPEEQLSEAGKRGEAWVKGYEAAGC